MESYKIIIMPGAQKAIEDNHKYICESYENEPAAITHTKDIARKIKSLTIFPRAHQVYEGITESNKEYRIARVRQYKIYYTVDEAKKEIHIAAVMHSHQNPESLELE